MRSLGVTCWLAVVAFPGGGCKDPARDPPAIAGDRTAPAPTPPVADVLPVPAPPAPIVIAAPRPRRIPSPVEAAREIESRRPAPDLDVVTPALSSPPSPDEEPAPQLELGGPSAFETIPTDSLALHRSPGRTPDPLRAGMMLDVGVPDGAVAAVVVRPVRAVRLDAGIAYNGISHGVRAGITLVPFTSWLTPTLSFAYGHYTAGDANPLARMITGDPTFRSAALDRVGYDYADAHVGIELNRSAFTFYARLGASRVTGIVHDAASLVGDTSMMNPTITFTTEPTVTITMVSARLGMIWYFAR